MQYTNGLISQIKFSWTDEFAAGTECTLSIADETSKSSGIVEVERSAWNGVPLKKLKEE